jgi:hypothetical protein
MRITNWTLWIFFEINKKRKFQQDITLLMELGSNTKWCEPLEHAVKQPTRKDIKFPEKPSKSGLIGVWHKDNLYLGTNNIGNGDPHTMNIDSRMWSIRITPWSHLFFDKLFFSSLEGSEIIPPTHNKCGKISSLIWKLYNPYMSGYAFIYTDSRLKQTLIDANLVITWSRNPHAKTPIPGKPSKSGLIGVWHKDNLHLGMHYWKQRPPPNEYWFANEKYKDDATTFFIEPMKGEYLTNTYTQSAANKKFY